MVSIRDILVFTPVYRLEPESVLAIVNLHFDGALSVLWQKDNPEPVTDKAAGIRNHFHQYERARETFLKGSWDAMLVVESDIIPPADTLENLIKLDTDLAYGVYRLRSGNQINVCERYSQPARNPGESLSRNRRKLRWAVREGQASCSGSGLGIVLIRRAVLERIAFRIDEPGVYCDHYFTQDAYRAGFKMRASFLAVCGHKDTSGEVLWPSLPS